MTKPKTDAEPQAWTREWLDTRLDDMHTGLGGHSIVGAWELMCEAIDHGKREGHSQGVADTVENTIRVQRRLEEALAKVAELERFIEGHGL